MKTYHIPTTNVVSLYSISNQMQVQVGSNRVISDIKTSTEGEFRAR